MANLVDVVDCKAEKECDGCAERLKSTFDTITSNISIASKLDKVNVTLRGVCPECSSNQWIIYVQDVLKKIRYFKDSLKYILKP